MWVEFLHADRRTDGRDEANSRFPQCLNAPEKIQDGVSYIQSPQQLFYAKISQLSLNL